MNSHTQQSNQAFWGFLSSTFLALILLLLITRENDAAQNVIMLCLGIIVIIVVLRFPIVGLGLTIVSTPLVELLPHIPYLSSVLPLLGGVTLAGFFLQRGSRQVLRDWHPGRVEVLAVLFILWAFVSNPNSFVFGRDRSWMLTFAQMLVLLWLGRVAVYTKQDHVILMSIIAGGILLSVTGVNQIAGLGSLDLVERAVGFSGGANTATRYFLYGILLLNYLQSRPNLSWLWRMLALAGICVLALGVVSTGSRTGLLLLILTLLMFVQHYLRGRQRSLAIWLILGVVVVWGGRQVTGTALEPMRIVDAITSSSDTVGTRYDLWQAGLSMWTDHPVSGIGIGRFREYLVAYWQSPRPPNSFSAHNTYVQVLAENGIVGLVLFGVLLVNGWLNFRRGFHSLNGEMAELSWTWMIIFFILLFGAVTKTELSDKFLWLLLGLSGTVSDLHEQQSNQCL